MKTNAPKHHIEEIKALLPHKTCKEIAEIIGCSLHSIYYYAKKFGLTGTHRRNKLNELERIVRECWATHTSTEIAEMAGCKPYDVLRTKNKLGLTRTKEEKAKTEEKRGKSISAAHQRIIKRDRRRMKFGMEPISKTFLTIAPKRVLQASYNLHSYHGYAYTDDPYVMSRNGHKIVSKRFPEEYYTKRYGFKFID